MYTSHKILKVKRRYDWYTYFGTDRDLSRGIYIYIIITCIRTRRVDW